MRRKAVSPVIATLLLIVIAVAAAVLTYIWVTGYMGTLQSQAGTQQVQERLKIEGVSVNTETNKIQTIYIRNIGDVKVNIATVYLLSSTGSVLAYDSTTLELTPEQLIGYDTSGTDVGGVTLTPGTTYIVKVVTSKGTEATYQFTYRT
jgi:flagellin-like protein